MALGTHAQTPAVLLRINGGGPSVPASPIPFAADEDATGGGTAPYPDAINTAAGGAAPAAIYQTVHNGNPFTYILPGLTPGRAYTLRLHFSEPWYGVTGRGGFPAVGMRLMNVMVNGTPALTNFDIYKTAGAADTAVVESLPATADANGKITVLFAVAPGSVGQNACVCGLEVLGTPPTAPTGLTATATGVNASVSLSWSAVAGAAGYNVYRGTVSGGPYPEITYSLVTGTSYLDAALADNKTYYYYVTAVSAGGESGSSSIASAMPYTYNPPPAAPTSLTAYPAYAQNTLTWAASVGATSYSIYRSTSSGGETMVTANATVSSSPYVDTGLTNGQTYYYVIQANNYSAASVSSGEAEGTPNSSASQGYYLPTYWGGNVTTDLPGAGQVTIQPFTFNSAQQTYSASVRMQFDNNSESGWATITGPVTTAFIYQPSGAGDTPPSSVIVQQDGTAGWGTSGVASGSCVDGVGQNSPYMTLTNARTSASGTQYTIVSSPGNIFTITAYPNVDVSANGPVVAGSEVDGQVTYDANLFRGSLTVNQDQQVFAPANTITFSATASNLGSLTLKSMTINVDGTAYNATIAGNTGSISWDATQALNPSEHQITAAAQLHDSHGNLVLDNNHNPLVLNSTQSTGSPTSRAADDIVAAMQLKSLQFGGSGILTLRNYASASPAPNPDPALVPVPQITWPQTGQPWPLQRPPLAM